MTKSELFFSMLRWLFWHLARIAGVVVFFAGFPGIVMACMDHRFLRIPLFVLLMAAALVVAIFANRRLAALGNHLEQEQSGIDHHATDELVVGMQWFWWFAILIAAVLFAALGGIQLYGVSTSEKLRDADRWFSLAGIAWFVAAILVIVIPGRLAKAAFAANYVFKLAPNGISYCLGFNVAWQNVHGIDLMRISSSRGGTLYYLVLALNNTGVETLRAARMPGLRDWLFIRFSASKGQLMILCAAIDMEPTTLCNIARQFAQRASVDFDPNWRLTMKWLGT